MKITKTHFNDLKELCDETLYNHGVKSDQVTTNINMWNLFHIALAGTKLHSALYLYLNDASIMTAMRIYLKG